MRLVEHPYSGCTIAGIGQDLPDVPLFAIKLPRKIGLGQAHDTIRVWISPGEDGRTRRTTLGRGTEVVLKQHPIGREAVEIRRVDGIHAIAVKMLSQVVAVE